MGPTGSEESDRLEARVLGDVWLHVTQTLYQVADLTGVSLERLDVGGGHRPRSCRRRCISKRPTPVDTDITWTSGADVIVVGRAAAASHSCPACVDSALTSAADVVHAGAWASAAVVDVVHGRPVAAPVSVRLQSTATSLCARLTSSMSRHDASSSNTCVQPVTVSAL